MSDGSGDEPRAPLPPAKIEDGKPFPPQREPKPQPPPSAPTGATKPPSQGWLAIPLVIILVLGGAIFGLIMCAGKGLGSMTQGLGRPLRERGRIRLARCTRTRPASSAPHLSPPSPWRRAWRAVQWRNAARMEHASVPAFEQLAAQLAALGAPAPLLARCHAAADDEARHARACFDLAHAYGGIAWTAHPLPAPRITTPDPAALAVETLLDGCIGEGVAAELARRAAARASEPVVAATLAMLATDEARHAELAWDVIAFCTALDPRVRPALAAAIDAPVRSATGPYDLSRAELRAVVRDHHAAVRARLAAL